MKHVNSKFVCFENLPEPALEKIFKCLSRADIDRLRIASPLLHKKLKLDKHMYLTEIIASRPRIINWIPGQFLIWSPDGKRLIVGSEFNGCYQFDPETGHNIGECVRIYYDDDYLVSITLSPDGTRLAVCTGRGSIQIWGLSSTPCGCESENCETCEAMNDSVRNPIRLRHHTYDNHAVYLAWSPDGNRLVSGGFDGSIRIWDPVTWSQIEAPLFGHHHQITALVWSPDGTRLASNSLDSTIRIWDFTDFMNFPGLAVFAPVWNGHKTNNQIVIRANVLFLTWSPDGAKLAACTSSNTIQIWDPYTGIKIRDYLESRYVRNVAWSPDGKRLASVGWDGTVRIWTQNGNTIINRNKRDGIVCVAWSPDGKRLASCGEDNNIRIYTP